MAPPFNDRLKAKAKTSKLFGLGLLFVYIAWEALTHAFYSWLDEHLAREGGPIVSYLFGWTIRNPYLLLLTLGVVYCLVVIIRAQFGSPATLIIPGIYLGHMHHPIKTGW